VLKGEDIDNEAGFAVRQFPEDDTAGFGQHSRVKVGYLEHAVRGKTRLWLHVGDGWQDKSRLSLQ